jgi:GTP pyrophosphokinase
MNELLEKELQLAEEISKKAHEGQKRRNGKPYFSHPSNVALRLHELMILESEEDKYRAQILAYLHDVIEDNPKWSYEKLLELGISMDTIVGLYFLTKKPDQTYDQYIQYIKHHRGYIVKYVKKADLLDNMSDLEEGHQKDKYRLALLMLEPSILC